MHIKCQSIYKLIPDILLYTVPAPVCPALNYTLAQMNTSLAVYGTYTLIRCDQGYKFEDGNSSKVLLCEEEGKWSDSVDGVCIGKLCKYAHIIEI